MRDNLSSDCNEAMAIYLRDLRGPSSVIAFHVSNRSVDLRPVVAALADEFHVASLEIFPPEVSDWILLSADPSVLGIPALTANGHSIELARPALLWTDDYSNLYSLLRSWWPSRNSEVARCCFAQSRILIFVSRLGGESVRFGFGPSCPRLLRTHPCLSLRYPISQN
jgi:hypothetical protein